MHSAVEASNSAATTSDTGNIDDTGTSEPKTPLNSTSTHHKKHKITKKKSKSLNTIWNVITNYGICWMPPQQYQH
jgi:hypothetical protein